MYGSSERPNAAVIRIENFFFMLMSFLVTEGRQTYFMLGHAPIQHLSIASWPEAILSLRSSRGTGLLKR